MYNEVLHVTMRGEELYELELLVPHVPCERICNFFVMDRCHSNPKTPRPAIRVPAKPHGNRHTPDSNAKEFSVQLMPRQGMRPVGPGENS